MAKRKSKSVRQVKMVLLVLFLLAVSFITAAPKLNLPFAVPTWEELAGKVVAGSSEAEKQPVTVHYLDVGQGDAVLIKSGGEAMLIDAGEKEYGETVLTYLKEQGIKKLKYAVCSHPHADHIGGMTAVLKALPVEQVLLTRLADAAVPTTTAYKNLLTAVKESGAKALYAKKGQELTLGKAVLQVLGPVKAYEELNNTSLVLRMEYATASFLFTGDEESGGEKDLVKSGANLKADVLKIGHHGSRTSTSAGFLKAVAPKTAIISCAKGNDYGHPHNETLNRLRKAGINILRTDINGTVVVGTDGKKLYYHTEKEAA